MTTEIFPENFWLSTTRSRQILNEKKIELKHKVKNKEQSKDIKKYYDSLGHPIIHEKTFFHIILRNKTYKVYVTDGYENHLRDKRLLEEEIYLNLKEKYRDSFKIIFEDE